MSTKKQSSKPRKKPGTTGRGRFYRIEVNPKGYFKTFRNQDVGKKGDLERLAGKKADGTWETVSWLIEKDTAHVSSQGKLIITDKKVKDSLAKAIIGPITHVKGDIFRAKSRRSDGK